MASGRESVVMRRLRVARNRRRTASTTLAGRRQGPGPVADPAPRPCARPDCPGWMHPRSFRLPARYVSRARRTEPERRAPMLWVWTCDACGRVQEGTGPR